MIARKELFAKPDSEDANERLLNNYQDFTPKKQIYYDFDKLEGRNQLFKINETPHSNKYTN